MVKIAQIDFYKMSGSGNDFILIDNRDNKLNGYNLPELAIALCRPKYSVGADGLIIIEKSNRSDFKWRFFNADGTEAEMCGNGGRCAARLAYILGICNSRINFETKAGIIRAKVEENLVKLEMPPPTQIELNKTLKLDYGQIAFHFINTGVPHTVIFLEKELENLEIKQLGKEIRFHPHFQPSGTNVDFVQKVSENGIKIRTYERGVEDETLSCGTGAVAASLICHCLNMVNAPVKVYTKSGEVLEVSFIVEIGGFKEVFLKGGARLVYQGRLFEEALEEDKIQK